MLRPIDSKQPTARNKMFGQQQFWNINKKTSLIKGYTERWFFFAGRIIIDLDRRGGSWLLGRVIRFIEKRKWERYWRFLNCITLNSQNTLSAFCLNERVNLNLLFNYNFGTFNLVLWLTYPMVQIYLKVL